MLKGQRSSTWVPSGRSCSLCPSKERTAESGPYLGLVLFFFFSKDRFFCTYISALVLFRLNHLSTLVFLAGHGRSWGAGVAHSPARVLWRGIELARRLAIGESNDLRAHHQPFQIVRVHGQRSTLFMKWRRHCDTIQRNSKAIFLCHQVFKGYVDDPRNTDNSWMETVAVNFHDESGINFFFFLFFWITFTFA